MATLYTYQKVTDKFTTHTLHEPDYQETEAHITELCTIDGQTYVSVPDTVTLPDQPETVKKTLQKIAPDDALKLKIKNTSRHVRLINDRVIERIREQYSVNDEIKMLRLAPSVESAAYNDYVEECRTWGQNEKKKLGV